MRIQFKDPDVQRLSHAGEEYEKTEEGVFDVPHDFAMELTRREPHRVRVWDGNPWPRAKTAEELEAERIAGVVSKVLEVQQQPAAAAPKPQRAPRRKAAKKKVAAKPKVAGVKPEAVVVDDAKDPKGGAAKK